jgi:probable HAF family extracellular repeat protein
MPFTSRFLPILLVPLLTIPCLASATPAYKVTGIVNEYNALPNGSTGSAVGINNVGQVTGSAYVVRSDGSFDTSNAAFWTNGSMTAATPSGFRSSNGIAINDSGTMLTTLCNPSSCTLGTIANGVVSNVPGLANQTYFDGHDINNRGQVTGGAYVPINHALYGEAWHTFLYSPGGGTVDLGTLGGLNSYGVAVNNAGVVAGNSEYDNTDQRHAFIYSDGTMRDLGTLGGAYSEVTALNDNGVAVGYSYRANDNVQRAVMYVDGQVIQIGGSAAWANSAAFGINNAGKVVGATEEFGGGLFPFLYSGGVMQNLSTMVEPGWDLSQAFAINDRDQILAVGYSPEGIYQYVLLTPDGASISLVPEPGQYIVLLLGLALLGFSINRQGLVRASIKP